jgi:hypothetical protein
VRLRPGSGQHLPGPPRLPRARRCALISTPYLPGSSDRGDPEGELRQEHPAPPPRVCKEALGLLPRSASEKGVCYLSVKKSADNAPPHCSRSQLLQLWAQVQRQTSFIHSFIHSFYKWCPPLGDWRCILLGSSET